jgi:hypothetical protein
MKVWITKYALTQGIIETDGQRGSCYPENCIAIMTHKNGHKYEQGFYSTEWHESLSDAINQAEKMRNNRIDSLKKQAKRLESLRFHEAKSFIVITEIKDVNGEIDWKPIHDEVYDVLLKDSKTDIVVCVRR